MNINVNFNCVSAGGSESSFKTSFKTVTRDFLLLNVSYVGLNLIKQVKTEDKDPQWKKSAVSIASAISDYPGVFYSTAIIGYICYKVTR